MADKILKAVEMDLTANILPYWLEHAPDPVHGGFHGVVWNDGSVDDSFPRSAVLTSRILWTFSRAYREYQNPAYLDMAKRANEYLQSAFWDAEYGGVYWALDAAGKPKATRKHGYAQGFAVYGLSEFADASGDAQSLAAAKRLFAVLDQGSHEPKFGGYIESSGRDWSSRGDFRLSLREPQCRKSMNTLLHILEGLANLLRVSPSPELALRVKELLEIFLDHVLDSQSGHFRLFFNDDWSWNKKEPFSYGHDIEGSWLLVECAEILGDRKLLERTRAAGLRMAKAVYAEALQADGRLLNESPESPRAKGLHWWAHAEAVVGFINAFQLTGDQKYMDGAVRVWEFIDRKFVDHQHGDWFKDLDTRGNPSSRSPKIGPWECPYHHSRMCFEVRKRLGEAKLA